MMGNLAALPSSDADKVRMAFHRAKAKSSDKFTEMAVTFRQFLRPEIVQRLQLVVEQNRKRSTPSPKSHPSGGFRDAMEFPYLVQCQCGKWCHHKNYRCPNCNHELKQKTEKVAKARSDGLPVEALDHMVTEIKANRLKWNALPPEILPQVAAHYCK